MYELAHALLCDGEAGLGARAALLMLARISPTLAVFTGGMIMPLMFVNAAATCYLVSLTAPLAFMETWKKALETTDGTDT